MTGWEYFNQIAPAWVQAIGSVAAIYYASRTILLASRSARLDKLQGIDAIFKLCVDITGKASKAAQGYEFQPDEVSAFPTRKFIDCVRYLENLSPAFVELGSERVPPMTSEALDIIRTTESDLSTLSRTLPADNRNEDIIKKIKSGAVEMKKLHDEITTMVQRQSRLADLWWRPF